MTRPIITIICPDTRTRDLLWQPVGVGRDGRGGCDGGGQGRLF